VQGTELIDAMTARVNDSASLGEVVDSKKEERIVIESDSESAEKEYPSGCKLLLILIACALSVFLVRTSSLKEVAPMALLIKAL
jgi:hypothetical protein